MELDYKKHETEPVEMAASAFGYRFRSVTDEAITEGQAKFLQNAMGKSHYGYGFYGFRQRQQDNGQWLTEWHCANSCD